MATVKVERGETLRNLLCRHGVATTESVVSAVAARNALGVNLGLDSYLSLDALSLDDAFLPMPLRELSQSLGDGRILEDPRDVAERQAQRFACIRESVTPEVNRRGWETVTSSLPGGPPGSGAKLVVLDDDVTPVVDGVSHGVMVRHVAREAALSSDRGEIVTLSLPVPRFSGHLLENGRQLAVYMLTQTSEALERILESADSKVDVINQSMGITQEELFFPLFRAWEAGAFQPAELVPANLPKREAAQRLLAMVGQVLDDPEVKLALERYRKASAALEQRDILHVVASSNSRGLASELEALGVPVPADFSESLLATADKIVVGASTGAASEQVAPHSSPSKYLSLVIDGTDIDTGHGAHTGTSFAAPQVSGLIRRLRARSPSLRNDEVRELLRAACTDTSAPKSLDGWGVLVPAKAVALLEERLRGGSAPTPRAAGA